MIEYQEQRDSADRWVAVKGVLQRLLELHGEDGVTMFDLGAQVGYFVRRAAEAFPDVKLVAVDKDGRMPKALEGTRVVPVVQTLGPEDLEGLYAEHAEGHVVTLALSLLHHVEEPEKMLKAMAVESDVWLVENPSRGEHPHTYRKEVAYPLDDLLVEMGLDLVAVTEPRLPGKGIDFRGARLRPTWLGGDQVEWRPVELTVAAGGRHASRTPRVFEQAGWGPVGFEPFAGSLNLHGEDACQVRCWPGAQELDLPYGRDNGRWGWARWSLWTPVMLNGSDVPACARVDEGRIEVVSPVKLRDELDVKNGDVVTVEPYDECGPAWGWVRRGR